MNTCGTRLENRSSHWDLLRVLRLYELVISLRLQERIATLKKQSSQIALQAQQERENFQREKNNLLLMLQKARTSSLRAASSKRSHDAMDSMASFRCCAGEREADLPGGEVRQAVAGPDLQQPPVHRRGQRSSQCECVALETGGWLLSTLWPLAAPALAEGEEEKRQRKPHPTRRRPSSQEKPAAAQLVRQVSGTHSSTKGQPSLVFFFWNRLTL